MKHKYNARKAGSVVERNLLKDRRQRVALEAAVAVVLLANLETGCIGSSTSLPATVTAIVSSAQASCSSQSGTLGYCDCMVSSINAAIAGAGGSLTPAQSASAVAYNNSAYSACVQSAGMSSFSGGDPWWG